jgi:hypothetical protein
MIQRTNSNIVLRAATAMVALTGLAVLVGSRVAPGVPVSIVVLYSALGAAAAFLVLTAATIATLTVMQFVLRKGGTDPQWFWFPSGPPGLERLRAQARKES